MRHLVGLILFAIAGLNCAHAQWGMQDSHTTASLRGIHSVDGTVAWASGTEGTVLRTSDSGAHWEKCATPEGAEKLDFRGIWAWDANTAEVMSAGPGEQSRLYKTSDGCRHWTEEARNTDKDGFWDAMVHVPGRVRGTELAVMVGDPVQGHFFTRAMLMDRWFPVDHPCEARDGEAAFAASNSMVFLFESGKYMIVTGGKGGPRALRSSLRGKSASCSAVSLPLAARSESAGAFSVYFRDTKHGVVVGGDYKKPNDSTGTAAFTSDGGKTWMPASKAPHGYRSAVARDEKEKFWVAAGTSGIDISRDDGKTWEPVDDGNWNALSLPYVVGPNGRIAKLRSGK